MTYRVTLPASFPYDQRTRAGITVTKQDGYEGELTKDQLATLKQDGNFTVAKATQDEESDTDAARKQAEEIIADATAKAADIIAEAEKHASELGKSHDDDGQKSLQAVPKKTDAKSSK